LTEGVVYNGTGGRYRPHETMPPSTQPFVRCTTLLLMTASLFVSAGKVVHAHVDGEHHHRLNAHCEHRHSHLEPVAWHVHVWLFGWEVHIPIGDEGGFDSHHRPVDLSPSWSDLPTDLDAPTVEVPRIAPAPEGVSLATAAVPTGVDCRNDCPPHSGLSPGHIARIWMVSLTL
jgi:hypothetical protein